MRMRLLRVMTFVPLIFAVINGCATNDAMTDKEGTILALALQRSYQDGGFAVVSPDTDVSELGGGNSTKVDHCKQFVLKGLQTNDPDVVSLVDKFFERNKNTIRLSIKSSPKDGYIIDRDGKFQKYFEKGGGGWDKWRAENPNAHGNVRVSMPVYDEKIGFVLIYIGQVVDALMGSGRVILFKQENGKLKYVKAVEIWIS
jgi:hypothetical protein